MEGKDPRDIHAGEKFGVCSFCVIVIKFIAKKGLPFRHLFDFFLCNIKDMH